jgi:hypothetical protein
MKHKNYFPKAILKFKTKVNNHQTLGRRSSFSVISQENILIITNSKKNKKAIDKVFFEKVFNRFQNDEENNKKNTSYFTDPKWNECPSRIFAPYVASIIKEMI